MDQFPHLFEVSGLSLDRLRTFLKVVEVGSLTGAAQGDQAKQSLYSRQIKELESYFGTALTRRVGRRIEITEEGRRLASIIQRQFSDLDDFRETLAGRSIRVSIGSQGSVIEWLLIPRLGQIRQTLGNVIVEFEQLRTQDTVRAVSDGRLDFGIVRKDALPPGTQHLELGKVGYALFASDRLWARHSNAVELLKKAPVAELIPGGQFTRHWHEWLSQKKLKPRVVTRVASFTDLAHVVQTGQAAAVLPDLAAVDFDPKKIRQEQIPDLRPRTMALIWNPRSLDRAGMAADVHDRLGSNLGMQ